MRWFEYATKCQCGESEEGFVPSEERFNIRCGLCYRYQTPLLLSRLDDNMTYEEYLDELFEEDEDWDEDEEEF